MERAQNISNSKYCSISHTAKYSIAASPRLISGFAIRSIGYSTCFVWLLALATPDLNAQEISGAGTTISPIQHTQAQRTQPLRIGETLLIEASDYLPSSEMAETERLHAMLDRNASGQLPIQNGFAREIQQVDIHLTNSDLANFDLALAPGRNLILQGGRLTWSARVRIEDSYAFRFRLDNVELPEGTRVWVYNPEGAVLGPVDNRLVFEGTLWLPAIEGPEIYLEISVPLESMKRGAKLRFQLNEILEIFDLEALERKLLPTKVWTDCDIDASCVTSGTLSVINNYYDAVARLSFPVGGGSFLCSGGLVNDKDPNDFRPFLLTANHCFDTQVSASGLTAYFDYKTSSCGGTTPSLSSVPQVNGATLLATNPGSDFTFAELTSNPSGAAYYLGWTTATPSNGEVLHRIAHPAGTAQKYSSANFLSSGGITCGGVPRPDFHYSSGLQGSTTGRSSGSPVITGVGGGRIVGQLLGNCQFQNSDDCQYNTFNYVDGAFGTTFPSISAWIDNEVPLCTDDNFETLGSDNSDDNCFGAAIAVGGAQDHLHCDEDWVFFVATSGATYRIETTSLVGGADTTLALHSDCGSELAFNDDAIGLASRIDWTATENGPIDIRIREFADSYTDGEGYTINVTCIAGCSTTIFADGFEDGTPNSWSTIVQ